ncbi:MAG: hypothetical protein HWQ43_21035 [Nostoc sp. JL31]|uniref:hypothetical protein n=1 Tax=Nostoc sp. JL31 TaxID=2815395 RepID=UPI0025E74F95|nr:hypothetical protein [Nostoc sp. JL31]MBN3891534.1 hypothetical protein [Nostoc sp. JL31]
MNNQILIKEKLQTKLENIQSKSNGSPITDLQLDKTLAAEIEKFTTELESVNPNLNPLVE